MLLLRLLENECYLSGPAVPKCFIYSYMTALLEEERVEVKPSEFLKLDSMIRKPLNKFQSLCICDLECLEASGVQINIELAGGAFICSIC